MKKSVLANAVGVLFMCGLAACGGGDGGSIATPAIPVSKITTTDQVAQIASAAAVSLGTVYELSDDVAFDNSTDGDAPASKSSVLRTAQYRSAKFRSKSTSAQPKAATACNGGGSVDAIPDTTTAYGDDGSANFSNCKKTYTFTDSGTDPATYASSDLINGKSSSRCTDSGQTPDSCNAITITIADGADGKTDLTDNYVYTNSKDASQKQDFTLTVRGNFSSSTSQSGSSSTASGALKYLDNLAKHEFSFTFDKLTDTQTLSDNGYSETINGSFGLTSNLPDSRCSIGKVTIKTNSPLTYSYNSTDGRPLSGYITVTDGAAQSSTLQYNSDSSVTITLANGTTKTYSAQQIDAACD